MAEQINWNATEARAKKMDISELSYAIRDCSAAAAAMLGQRMIGKDSSYYVDELSVYVTELNRR